MDPAICKPYFDCIDTDSNFISNGVNVEEKDTKTKCDVSFNYLPIKTENSNIKIEGDSYEETRIEPEFVGIKSEIDEESVEETRESRMSKYETELNQLEALKDPLESKMQPFDHNNQTKVHSQNVLNTKDLLMTESYKCWICVYETNLKSNFTRHMWQHKERSHIKWYACDKCGFKTKFPESLSDHQLKHTHPLQMQIFKCEECEYETKHRSSLTTHRLKHKHPSEIRMYKCALCPYQTKSKSNFKIHRMRKNSCRKTDVQVQK